MNRDDVMNIFSNIIKTYNENNIGLKGMNLGFFSLYLNKLLKETDNGIIVVTPTIYEANKLYQNFSDTKDVFLYETDDVLTSLATSKSPELKVEKLNILKESLNNNKKIIITDINGYLKKLPSINDFKNNIIKLKIGTDINLKNIVDNLYEIGYEKETLVTKPGEFGVRGFILDIFPLNEENPIRIEFFGDTIESIRYFEVESQKSLENIDEIEIYSISKTSEKYSSLYEYLNRHLEDSKYKVFKPMPCPIDKIQNRYRWRIIIKGNMDEKTNKILNTCLKQIYNKNLKHTKVNIDVNPNNMM